MVFHTLEIILHTHIMDSITPGTGIPIRSSASKGQLELARSAIRPNLVKSHMVNNRLATSFGMRVAFSTEIPLIAKRAGYSAVLMNLEHMAMSIETMKDVAVSCLNVGYVACRNLEG